MRMHSAVQMTRVVTDVAEQFAVKDWLELLRSANSTRLLPSMMKDYPSFGDAATAEKLIDRSDPIPYPKPNPRGAG